jgi:Na+/H+ antiporter NhaD/arsenite permease-like protein
MTIAAILFDILFKITTRDYVYSFMNSMFTVILLALLCVAIIGVVVYIFVLDDKKSIRDWFSKEKKTESEHHSRKDSLFELGL